MINGDFRAVFCCITNQKILMIHLYAVDCRLYALLVYCCGSRIIHVRYFVYLSNLICCVFILNISNLFRTFFWFLYLVLMCSLNCTILYHYSRLRGFSLWHYLIFISIIQKTIIIELICWKILYFCKSCILWNYKFLTFLNHSYFKLF